LIASPCNTWR